MSERATIEDVLSFVDRLKAANIHYSLSDHTTGALMVEVAVPGERWEVEFHEDGSIGVEVFVTNGPIRGIEVLNELFERFTD